MVVLAMLLGCTTMTWSQSLNHKVAQELQAVKAAQEQVDKVSPFKKVSTALKSQTALPTEISQQALMTYEASVAEQLIERSPGYFELAIPGLNNQTWELQLQPNRVFADDFIINTPHGEVTNEVDLGKFYRGTVKGIENSIVSVAFYQGDIKAIISTPQGNFNLGKLEDSKNTYILYNEAQLDSKKTGVCGTEETEVDMKKLLSKSAQMKAAEKCVEVYFEVDYDVYQNKGNLTATSNFITAVFNEVATLYQNDGMVIVMSELFIWDSSSPYSASNSSGYLSDFRGYRTSFNGDIAHLVSLKSSYGGVAYVDVLCNSSYGYGWSGINANYNNVPTYSWTVEVVAHELGHQIGSPHTQSCSWPGGAIDNCYTTEGTCGPGPQPENGGTIMSYCHLTSTGINFNNGFGPLPGDLLRSRVASKSCITSCEVGEPVCSVPSNVQTSNVSATGFTVSWNAVGSAVSYDVRYRESGGSWITVSTGGTSYNVTGLSPLTSYQVQVQSNCADEVSGFSGSANVTTISDEVTYCASSGNDFSYEWIAGVLFNGVSKTSGAAGYSDFTNVLLSAQQGESVSLTLTPGFANSTYNEYFTVWADFNGDGDFDDMGETLYQSGAVRAAVSGTASIPANATLGATRLRVSMRYNAAPSSCGSFSYGEVEDYTLVVEEDVPQPCNTPLNLSQGATSETSIAVSWDAAGSNETSYRVQHRATGTSTWTSNTVSGTSFTASGLTPSTSYQFRVRANCGSDQSANTSAATFSTNDPAPCNTPTGLSASAVGVNSFNVSWSAVSGANNYTLQHKLSSASSWSSQTVSGTGASLTGLSANTQYDVRVRSNCDFGSSNYSGAVQVQTEEEPVVVEYCDSEGQSSSNEWIASVQVGGVNNSSGNNGGYGDFTSVSGNLVIGGSNSFTLNPGFTGFWIFVNRYPEYWRIWVDLNRDGDFNDAGELVMDAGQAYTSGITGSFGIPSSATPGETRMRISMKYNSAAGSCETFARGEVEDYTVNLVNGISAPQTGSMVREVAVSESDMQVAPNPMVNGLTKLSINWSDNATQATMIVLDITGKVVTSRGLTNEITETEIDLSHVPSGVYVIQVQTDTGEQLLKRVVKQ